MATENDKTNEFKELISSVESPDMKLSALKHEIDMRQGSSGMTLDGTLYRPNYGSSADQAYARQEMKEHRMRMGDWP